MAARGERQASPHMHESVRLEPCHLRAGTPAAFDDFNAELSEVKASSLVSVRPSRGSLPPPPPPEAFAAARRPSPEELESTRDCLGEDSLPPPPPPAAAFAGYLASLPPPPPAAAGRPAALSGLSRFPPPPAGAGGSAGRPAAVPGVSRFPPPPAGAVSLRNSAGPAGLSRRQSRRLQNRASAAPYDGASSSTGCRRVFNLWPGLR